MSGAIDGIRKADDDIDAASRCLEPPPNLAVAAYDCQQAAEKVLKALLVQLGLQNPRGRGGHDLAASADLLPPTHPLRAEALALDAITDWGTAFRYPADDPFTAEALPTLEEARGWLLRIGRFCNDVAEAIARPPSNR